MSGYALHSTETGRNRVKVPCGQPWPPDCFLQSGDRARFIAHARHHGFAWADEMNRFFFEAFPREPDTFLRGEGNTFASAELSCWTQYDSIRHCSGHEFERNSRTDGFAVCRHCGLAGKFLEPTSRCRVCGVATAHHAIEREGRETGEYLCPRHWWEQPEADWNEYRQRLHREGVRTLSQYERHVAEIYRQSAVEARHEWENATIVPAVE